MPAPAFDAIQAALRCYQAGQLAQAETLCQQILKASPKHPDGLHLSGMIASLMGRNEAAVDLISRAISIKPSCAMYYNLGSMLHDLGQLEAAVENYRKALRSSRISLRRTAIWGLCSRIKASSMRRSRVAAGRLCSSRILPRRTATWDLCSLIKASLTRRSRVAAKRWHSSRIRRGLQHPGECAQRYGQAGCGCSLFPPGAQAHAG